MLNEKKNTTETDYLTLRLLFINREDIIFDWESSETTLWETRAMTISEKTCSDFPF